MDVKLCEHCVDLGRDVVRAAAELGAVTQHHAIALAISAHGAGASEEDIVRLVRLAMRSEQVKPRRVLTVPPAGALWGRGERDV